MKILISADSTCDLPKELLEKHNISLMPLIITLNDKEYRDGVDIDVNKLYETIESTGNMPIASEEIGSEKVTVVDTKSLSTGSGLLILYCAEKIAAGKSLETIKQEIEQQISKVQASFLIDTLKFLHKGGRCSSLALLGANLLKIKPRISLVDGEMKVTKKYMGNINISLNKYVADMLEECPPNLDRVFVTCSSPMEAQEKIANNLKEYGFKEVIMSRAGCTVCTHCGKNTLGILYFTK